MLKINSIAIEGFGSIQKPTDFDFTDGLHVVKGFNGHGKSTLFSALCWGLFQTNIKGGSVSSVATWEHLRLPSFKGTRVIVYLSVGIHPYMVARHLNYKGTTQSLTGSNRLMVFKQTEQGWELTDGQHKADQQEAVDTLLGMDAHTFLNSVMFGQRMKRLVEADADQKRAIFDKLFNVGFVDEAAARAKAVRDEINTELTKGNAEADADRRVLQQLRTQLETQQAHLDHFEADKEERVLLAGQSLERAKARVTDTEETLKTLRTELSKVDTYTVRTARERIKAAEENLDNVRKEKREAETQEDVIEERLDRAQRQRQDTIDRKAQLNHDIAHKGKEAAELVIQINNVSTKCPTCEGNLPPHKIDEAIAKIRDRKEQIEKEYNQLRAKLKDVSEDEDKLIATTKELRAGLEGATAAAKEAEAKHAAATKELAELVKSYPNLSLMEDKAKALERQIHQCEAELKVFTEDVTKAENTLTTEQAKQPPVYDMEALDSQLTELSYKINAWAVQSKEKEARLQRVTWWATKGFNAGGLRAHVFNSMLALLNDLVKKYADRLNAEVVFGVDMAKANKPFTTTCYRDGHAIDYKDLSGGQKQRIDVAVAFAMHDLVARAAPINLLVLDECMEGLDEEGVDAIFDLLRMKQSAGLSIYVITHQQSLDIVNSKTLYVSIDEDGCTNLS